jgi:hypothetical protein
LEDNAALPVVTQRYDHTITPCNEALLITSKQVVGARTTLGLLILRHPQHIELRDSR